MAVTMGRMRIWNKVSENKVLNFNKMANVAIFKMVLIALNYLYVAVTVAIWRRNRKDSAVASIAITEGKIRIQNKVNKHKALKFNNTVNVAICFPMETKVSLNYLYVAVMVAIRRRNRKDSAAVSIAETMGGMRIQNKVS